MSNLTEQTPDLLAAMWACSDKNEEGNPGWCEDAVESVRAFVLDNAGQWTIEQIRAAIADDLPEPHDLRAWGAVANRAIRLEYIRATGQYAPAKSSNGAPKRLYTRGSAA